ncbi:flagellin, partial [Campylobacter sp. LR185c]
MAIADNLRQQASTLGQAINNANDALSVLQTADKAMDEQISILETIKTKATQAAQDGQSLATRTMLQADINRLMEELDNIANTTSFNGKQLLSGSFTNQEFQIGSQSNTTVSASIGATQSSKIGVTRFETGSQSLSSGTVSLTIKNYNGIEDFTFRDVVISTSVNTGIGALAEEINRVADKTGVRASYSVQTTGTYPIQAGSTSVDFAINGVTIGQTDYYAGDQNGALIAAINSVKDTTGVEASIDDSGRLVLNSADGRGIEITGSMGAGSGVLTSQYTNYGRLSLVKNDGRDISISGTGLSAIGMGATDTISQASISLRESKAQISVDYADAIGANSYAGGGNNQIINFTGFSAGNDQDTAVAAYMSAAGSGFSAGSGYSINSGHNYSALIKANAVFVNYRTGVISNAYIVSAGSGYSTGSGLSQYASFRVGSDGSASAGIDAYATTSGVTTLAGAMAVMDIAETAIADLDAIRAD